MANKKKTYTATAKVMNRLYVGKGSSVYEAISNIKPGLVAGTVILKVENKERILPVVTARRLFSPNTMTREVALKNMSLIFEGV